MAASFIERNSTMLQISAGALFVILTVALTWYFGTRNRMTKTIDYQVLSNVAVLTNTGARPERLKILFDDTEAKDPFITQIRIENTGKQVIEPEDFLTCVQIYRDNCTILEWGVVEESADGVSGYIGMTIFPGESERIDTTPGTMNPGDWFTIQIVSDGDRHEPLCVTSRMRGEKRPMQEMKPERRARRIRIFLAIVLPAISATIGYTLRTAPGPDLMGWAMALALTGLSGLLVSSILFRTSWLSGR